MKLYELQHLHLPKTAPKKQYFVESYLGNQEFNLLCAYIQVVHCYECPKFTPKCPIEEVIWPDTAMDIINRMYGFNVWVESDAIGKPFQIIDLYENWQLYCCNNFEASKLNQYAVIDAGLQILESMRDKLLSIGCSSKQLNQAISGSAV